MFSDKLTFITAQTSVPTEPGTPFEGGYYAGRIMVDGVEYALVVAPKTQGGEPSYGLRFSSRTNFSPRGESRNDGKTNTAKLLGQEGGCPAASFCINLEINGYNDWYLPSRDESEILYRAFKPTTWTNARFEGANPSSIPPTTNYTPTDPAQTSVGIFKVGGSEAFLDTDYWTSSIDQSYDGVYYRSFSNGYLGREGTYYAYGKPDFDTVRYRVRAVRRVAL